MRYKINGWCKKTDDTKSCVRFDFIFDHDPENIEVLWAAMEKEKDKDSLSGFDRELCEALFAFLKAHQADLEQDGFCYAGEGSVDFNGYAFREVSVVDPFAVLDEARLAKILSVKAWDVILVDYCKLDWENESRQMVGGYGVLAVNWADDKEEVGQGVWTAQRVQRRIQELDERAAKMKAWEDGIHGLLPDLLATNPKLREFLDPSGEDGVVAINNVVVINDPFGKIHDLNGLAFTTWQISNPGVSLFEDSAVSIYKNNNRFNEFDYVDFERVFEADELIVFCTNRAVFLLENTPKNRAHFWRVRSKNHKEAILSVFSEDVPAGTDEVRCDFCNESNYIKPREGLFVCHCCGEENQV